MAKKQRCGKTWGDRFPGFPPDIQEKIGFFMKQNIRTRTARIHECHAACREVKIALEAAEEMTKNNSRTRRAAKCLDKPADFAKGGRVYPLGIVQGIWGGINPHARHSKGADVIRHQVWYWGYYLKPFWKVNKHNHSRRYELTDEYSNKSVLVFIDE